MSPEHVTINTAIQTSKAELKSHGRTQCHLYALKIVQYFYFYALKKVHNWVWEHEFRKYTPDFYMKFGSMATSFATFMRRKNIKQINMSTVFETDFASEIPLSAIKSMICRRFSSFRFWFYGRFIGFLCVEVVSSKSARNTFPMAKSSCVFSILFLTLFIFYLSLPSHNTLRSDNKPSVKRRSYGNKH